MQLACPQCGRMLEAPLPLPAQAKCPFCAAVFAPAAAAPASPAAAAPPSPYAPPAPYGAAPGYVPPPPLYADPQRAAAAVQAPAIALLVTGILDLIFAILDVLARIFMLATMQQGQLPPNLPPFFQNMFNPTAVAIGLVTDAVGIVLAVVIISGAVKMRRLESFGLALAASVISMLPFVTTCCCIGIPFGIWSLVVINKPEVRPCFH